MEIVVHLYDVLVVQLAQYLILLLRSHLLFDVIEASYFYSKILLLLKIVLFVAHINGGMHALSKHLTLLINFVKLSL